MALTASHKTSEKQEVDQASAEAAAFRALRTKVSGKEPGVGAKNQIHQGWNNDGASEIS